MYYITGKPKEHNLDKRREGSRKIRKQRQGELQEHEADNRLGKSVYNAEKSLSDAPRTNFWTVEQALAGNPERVPLCNGSERRLEIQNVSVTGSW